MVPAIGGQILAGWRKVVPRGAPAVLSALVASVVLASCATSGRQAAPVSRQARGAPVTTSSVVAAPPTTTAPSPSPPPRPAPPTTAAPSPPPALGPGDHGPAVLALQQRLTSLGYWLGSPDGNFSGTTEQAVFALQKAAGIGRDGSVGPVTSAALAQGVVPHPRSTSGQVIEVDLAHQLVMFVSDGKLEHVLNTSTGGGYKYTDQGVTYTADTPVGTFHVYRQVDGMVVDSLGQLWRPKFFDSGFALHGDTDVPPEPVSHGCVRLSNDAINWIWSANLAPVGTEVSVY